MREFLRVVKEYLFTEADNSIPENHVLCDYCGGHGWEDMFVVCDICEGTGHYKMSYQEYVKSLPPLEENDYLNFLTNCTPLFLYMLKLSYLKRKGIINEYK